MPAKGSKSPKQAERLRKQWLDPAFREKVSRAAKEARLRDWQDPDYRAVQRTKMERLWQDPDYREKMEIVNRQNVSDPEWRRQQAVKMRTLSNKLWKSPEYRELQVKKMTKYNADPKIRAEHSRRIISLLRSGRMGSPSKPEQTLAALLDDMELDYQQQVHIEGYRGVPDFLLPDYNLVIEVDGVFWHRLRKAADRKRTKQLQALGYMVLRISDKQMLDLETVRHKIAGQIQEFRE